MPVTQIRVDESLFTVDLLPYQNTLKRIARERTNAIKSKTRTHRRALNGNKRFNLDIGHLYGVCGEAAYALYHNIPLSRIHGGNPSGDGGVDFYHPFITKPRMVTVDVKHTAAKDVTSMYLPIFGNNDPLRASIYVLARRGERMVIEGEQSYFKPDAYMVILQGWITRPEIRELAQEVTHPNDGQKCLEVSTRYLRPIQTLSQWMKHNRDQHPSEFDTMEAYARIPGDYSDYRNLREEHLTGEAKSLPTTIGRK